MYKEQIIIHDVIYGEIIIKDAVFHEIICAPTMERLKDIDMAGYSAGFNPGCGHSRFEHSVGVYHLLTCHGASLEERIHGLLHDISHTAFSHAVDYALDGSSGDRQDFQDRIFNEFVMSSEIPEILKQYDLDPDYVFDESNFPLQERPIPNLCADRLDYSLRGFYHYGILETGDITKLLDGLRSDSEDWYFSDQDLAYKYAKAFAEIDEKVYSSLKSAAMFRSIGDCLKYALSKGYLHMDDLFTTDSLVLKKLEERSMTDPILLGLWRKMCGEMAFKDDPKDFDAIVKCKSRIVDPKFLTSKGEIKTLSEERKEWISVIERGLVAKTYHLKFI